MLFIKLFGCNLKAYEIFCRSLFFFVALFFVSMLIIHRHLKIYGDLSFTIP